ncbi:MAG: hypothetical protein IMF15_02180 [Proteobacteria bacterium]|nr:hypothetical protein [Pseudomonadota bacterium]
MATMATMPEQDNESLKVERRNSWLDKHHASQQGDVIYVLRTAQQHHVMLGMIADQKANIVLGTFLIFITVTQTVLENHSQYSMAMWILSAFFTISAIFALLVITPRFRNPKPASGKPSNLLFFGSFSVLDQDEFVNALRDSLQDNEQARTLMMRDIYQIGKVLDKKYVNLRLSYLSLGTGIIASAISFSVLHLSSL